MTSIARALLAGLLVALVASASAAPQPAAQFAPALAEPSIADIQRQLAAHGYRPGPATGRVDAATRAAILAYQKDARLTQDGIASPALQDHLRFAAPKIYAKARAADPLVAEAQEELTRLGYYKQAVDGVFGAATRTALARFRSDNNLPPEPRLTAQTLAALRQAVPH